MLLTLTSDFGLADGYVGALKGAIHSAAPGLTLVDVSHDVPARDVMAAAFVLQTAVPHFPAGTVHLAVIDADLGAPRRSVAARFTLGGRPFLFVGPDNGLLPLVLDGGEPDEAVVLDRAAAWRTPTPSATFLGRDVLGPVAAALAAGAQLGDVGTAAGALERLHWPLPRTDPEGIDGMVVAVDHYGNCITNVPRDAVARWGGARGATLYVGSEIIHGIRAAYRDVARGEPLALFGSHDRLEIAVRSGHASSLLSVQRGDSVTLVFDLPPHPPLDVRVAAA